MDSKIPVFIIITMMFLPLLIFAENIGIYTVVSFFIIFALSIENILYILKYSKNKKLVSEMKQMEKELESKSVMDLKKLALGFKTAKTIFITTFVISILLLLEKNMYLVSMSVFVLFFSVIELKHHRSKKIASISFYSGITNILYLTVVAATKYII